jgi:hypothetical protein
LGTVPRVIVRLEPKLVLAKAPRMPADANRCARGSFFAMETLSCRRKMFEDIGKPNLLNLLVLGAIGAVLPKLLPGMRPAIGTAVKVVIDLVTESEAEATEELVEALVSGTIGEINRQLALAEHPEDGRRSVECSLAQFKHKARQRAHRWGSDDKDRHRRYRRHLRKLREEMKLASPRHDGWQRDIFDELGEAVEEEA